MPTSVGFFFIAISQERSFMSITVTFGTTTDPAQCANKTFTQIGSPIAGDPIETEDILYPTFLVDYDSSLLGCNYCKVDYTETFSRYYFCSVSTENGGNMRINCALDAVKTYWDEYKGTPMTVVRSTSFGSPQYIPDGQFPLLNTKRIKTLDFEQTIHTSGGYVSRVYIVHNL